MRFWLVLTGLLLSPLALFAQAPSALPPVAGAICQELIDILEI